MNKFDIVIVGGGLSGIIAASMLNNLPYNILILEAGEERENNSNIGLVLNAASLDILNKVGGFRQHVERASDINKCVIAVKNHFGRIRLPEIPALLAKVMPVKEVAKCFASKVKSQHNVTILYNSSLKELQQQDYNNKTIVYEHHGVIKNVTTKLVIAADGYDSTVRSVLDIGVDTEKFDYSCVVSNVIMRNKNTSLAMQRFLVPGSLAFIPGNENKATLIWTLETKKAQAKMLLSRPSFLKLLQSDLANSLGQIVAIEDNPITYPVKLQRATKCSVPGVVLLGSTANQLLPITAQGLNMTIRDIATLVDILKKDDSCVWDKQKVISYHNLREKDHDFTYKQIKYSMKLLNKETIALNLIRSILLNSAAMIPNISNIITKSGAGYLSYNQSSFINPFF